MLINISQNYSPNFNKFRRNRKNIKFLVIHYTGMKSEKKALNRLTDIQSEVSSHYFVKKSGKVLRLIPDLYIAWHSGKSMCGFYSL